MQRELHDTYKGRKIDLSVEGYGASEHTRVVVNDLNVSSRVLQDDTSGNAADLGLVIIKVRRMIDGGNL